MKNELSEYYGNKNNRTAKVLIETTGDGKKFLVECYNKKDLVIQHLNFQSEREAEDFAEDYVLNENHVKR